MTSELLALTLSAVLCALLPLTYGAAQTSVWGLAGAMGNRERMPELPDWANRAIRAHRNLIENLAHFSVLVLVAALVGVSSALTVAGAWIFFWARIVHAAVYIAGIPYVRTAAYFAGTAGELLILAALVGAAA